LILRDQSLPTKLRGPLDEASLVTMSIGCVSSTARAPVGPAALAALYRAKALGRNRAEEADEGASHGIARTQATKRPG
jgi:GGDEF domain-containing protein